MRINYLAHAAFLLTSSKGTSILTDPYEVNDTIKYHPITAMPDIITISHNHPDHSHLAPEHSKLEVFSQPGSYQYKDISFAGIGAFHDTEGGKIRGKIVIFVFHIDGITICHLGDLGHTLNQEQLAALGSIDVLLLPVGGVYTIDAKAATLLKESIKPKICIPMHYKTSKVVFDLAPVTEFIGEKENVKKFSSSEVEITKNHLPESDEIWVLEPNNL